MKITIPSWQSCHYRELFLVTEWRDGAVYRTRRIGFVRADRPIGPDEIYAPLSTSITKQPTISLELIE